MMGHAPLVSIPIGFSHQLRLHVRSLPDGRRTGFNPYRVFSSAETESAERLREVLWFQSLSGFLIS